MLVQLISIIFPDGLHISPLATKFIWVFNFSNFPCMQELVRNCCLDQNCLKWCTHEILLLVLMVLPVITIQFVNLVRKGSLKGGKMFQFTDDPFFGLLRQRPEQEFIRDLHHLMTIWTRLFHFVSFSKHSYVKHYKSFTAPGKAPGKKFSKKFVFK